MCNNITISHATTKQSAAMKKTFSNGTRRRGQAQGVGVWIMLPKSGNTQFI